MYKQPLCSVVKATRILEESVFYLISHFNLLLNLVHSCWDCNHFFLSLEATSRPRNNRVVWEFFKFSFCSVWFYRAYWQAGNSASDLSPELLWFTSNTMLVPLFSNILCKSPKLLTAWWISLWRSSSKASWFWMTSNIFLESTDVDTNHKIKKTKSCNGVQRPGDRYSYKTSENTCVLFALKILHWRLGGLLIYSTLTHGFFADFFSTVMKT